LQEAGNIRRDELFFEETQQRLDVFGRRLSKALARFTGTPNRLLRNADTVARIAPEREGTGPAQTAGSGEPEEEELEPTDPPVECPRCGQVLYCDREMTVLVCQACGIRETLE
ncbi:hypothetical protein JW921_04915, partial [Candidatus Fermentibacterales bacterium]|nr:hypothetical protein [Candidatus Fermentibacterales bacterium]